MLTHRPASAKDLALICDFPQTETELFFAYPTANFPLTPEQLQNAIKHRFDPTVILLEEKVNGFANFRVREYGGMCEIGNVMVALAARRRGVARFLVRFMAHLAFSKYAAEEVQLACFNENVAGLFLYTKLHFRPFSIEERRDKRGSAVALIHMRLLKGKFEDLPES